jgi:putative NADH-flavin reductase
MWLFKAKKRYGLRVLNYMAASNHIIWSFLLPALDGSPSARAGQWVTGDHPKLDALIAGRTAQEFNQRKKRKGAF